MKTLLVLFAVALAVPPVAAAATRSYAVQPFERIHASADVKVQVQVGAPQSVAASSDGNDLDDLVVAVERGTLLIRQARRWFLFNWFSHPHYTVTVTVPVLSGVAASASARVEVAGAVTQDAVISAASSGRAHVAQVRGGKVELRASSSGRLDLGVVQGEAVSASASSSGRIRIDELHSPKADIHASSSGRVEASGDCNTLDASASSSGRIRAGGLHCQNVTAGASSSGGIDAYSSGSLVARASSSGHISVDGNPQRVDRHESSSGSVRVGN